MKYLVQGFGMLLVLVLVDLGRCDPVCLNFTLSRECRWHPLGKFVFGPTPLVRARVNINETAEAQGQASLLLVSYAPDKWNRTVVAPDCEHRAAHQKSEHRIFVPLNGSWSKHAPLMEQNQTVFLAAADCFTKFSSQVRNTTVLEISGGTYWQLSDEELARIAQSKVKPQPAPIQVHDTHNETAIEEDEDTANRQNATAHESYTLCAGLHPLNIAAAMFLLLGIILVQWAFGSFKQREFIFSFVLLIMLVVARLLLHAILITEALMPSESLAVIATFMEPICQFAFALHCVLICSNWPPGNFCLILVNGVLLTAAYGLINYGFSPIATFALRVLLVVQLIVCFVMGRGKPAQDSGQKVITVTVVNFLAGAVLLTAFAVLEGGNIFLPELFVYGHNYVHFFQAVVVSSTLVLSGMLSRPTKAQRTQH